MTIKKISYKPLWDIMVDRQLPKNYLCYNDTGVHITTKSLTRLSKDDGVSITTLLRICTILDVELSDVCKTVTYDLSEEDFE